MAHEDAPVGNESKTDGQPTLPNFTKEQPQSNEPALEMLQLAKVFGNTVAVADMTLSIPTGSFYGIVGPNGAGKTTCLNMATGLLKPDHGTARICGIDMWTNQAEAKTKLGVMPDGMRLFNRLSGPALVTYMGMLRGLDKDVAQERADALVRALGLEEAQKKPVSDYSAGMTKKIALACSLVHGPRVLVLDEPFEAVDPISAANIRDILSNFVGGGGTVVLSSHVMANVQKMCSHVAIINHGKVLTHGTTEEVSQGKDLDDVFTSLIGGVHHAEGLEWLQQ
ncbi:ABC transporter ATP-binding protein [Gleimia hominis]